MHMYMYTVYMYTCIQPFLTRVPSSCLDFAVDVSTTMIHRSHYLQICALFGITVDTNNIGLYWMNIFSIYIFCHKLDEYSIEIIF